VITLPASDVAPALRFYVDHKTPIRAWDGGFAPGLDPARGHYASFANLSDPDGNSWVLQEWGYREV
jgi:hypothetical protein